MTVGNEEYGNWETDLHAKANDPTTYAASVVGSSGYYHLIKTASPNTKVGVVVDANASNGCCTVGWDSTVLTNAKGSYDFVEFHFYPQNPDYNGDPNPVSDAVIINQSPAQFTQNINTIKQELTTVGESNTPIYVGEMGSVSSNPGIQSWSITQGLFAGQILGEMMNDGVSRATWWIGFGNCNGDEGDPWDGTLSNNNGSLYGWQTFGAYNVFADPSGDTGGGNASPCNYGGGAGTMSPTAQAYNLFQNVAVDGEAVLTPTVTGDTTDVHAYTATAKHLDSTGVAVVLFNLNETTSENVQLNLTGVSNSSDVTVITYDKEIYDYTNTNCALDPSCTVDPNHNYSDIDWAPPTSTDMGTQSLPLTLTLTPWSMNVVLIK
jgi:alpha-L-arabinofuranosidase